jgi:hypothetical protein
MRESGRFQRSTNSTIAWALRLPIAAEIGILFTGKASLSGGVGPVFAGVADPIGSGFVASLARRGGRRCWPRSFVALEPRCDPQSNDAAAVLQADAGRVLPVFENFPLAQSEFGVAAAMGLDVIDASCGHDAASGKAHLAQWL